MRCGASQDRSWDAFERLKTIDIPGGDKKKSVQVLLEDFLFYAYYNVIRLSLRKLDGESG